MMGDSAKDINVSFQEEMKAMIMPVASAESD
jgi:hypothetical protein